MLNIFSGASLPFGIPQVRILCSVLSPYFLMGLFDFLEIERAWNLDGRASGEELGRVEPAYIL
jgi:hypothetical protein